MVKPAKVQFHMPDEQGWRDIRRECHLSKAQLDAVHTVVQEVADACVGLTDDHRRSETRKKVMRALSKTNRLLENLEAGLRGQDVVVALRSIETFGTLGLLMSASSTLSLPNYGDEDVIETDELERLIARKKFGRESIRASELDALSMSARQRRLQSMTPEAMLFIVQCLRQPFSSWLLVAQQNKGGNPAQTDRDVLILLLARDAVKIIGRPATRSSTGDFMDLCSSVLGACGMETTGLAEAIRRCLDKHASFLQLHALPAYLSPVGKLTEEQIAAIPEDPEQTQ